MNALKIRTNKKWLNEVYLLKIFYDNEYLLIIFISVVRKIKDN